MKNKIEITRKQLDVFGDLITKAELLLSEMIKNNQSGPPSEDAKYNKGLCKKLEGNYWWNDTLALHKMARKACGLFVKLHERMNQNGA